MSLLAALYQAGVLRTVDDALAQSLCRLDPETPDMVAAAAALASLAVAHGHAGVELAHPGGLAGERCAWPSGADWAQMLRASPWVAEPSGGHVPTLPDCPLVLEHGVLYLRRYREYERRLASGVLRVAAARLLPIEPAALAPVFAVLFPQGHAGQDRQARAAALALQRALLLITGGPGTGKTTTIARLLVLRIAQARQQGVPPPRIALAAPTGRAAERMAESLRAAAARVRAAGLDAALLAALPSGASTVHRLLGVVPDTPRFRHHADNPLPYDLIVIDEASMVDLPLMCKLVDAVADGTQLILLGDPDQLPSVEAGDVLAAILAAAGAGDVLDAADAQALVPLLGKPSPAVASERSCVRGSLHGHRVHLQNSHRQGADFDLAPLAAAVRLGDAGAVLGLLRGGTLRGVQFHAGVLDPCGDAGQMLLAHWRALAALSDPVQALAAAARVRLLTALRDGPQGASGLNARIEHLLGGRRGGADEYFHGRLVLITENSSRHRLFNGDIGVCLREPDGTVWAWFSGEGAAGVRAFAPAALPAHESAFAMTVHKAQGSECDTVWLQLPRQDSRVLSRELIYTGLTRARHTLHLAGGEAVLCAALARHAVRVSGLAWRLGADPTGWNAVPTAALGGHADTSGMLVQGELF
ncbi:exodeoxyribonuclease V subunit alpha [Xylella taiwanensis]|uniref:RecBCD enzyme subunit RecD n=1 Tax=Xylella taiwanensis TaxID=1444770 RepID=Z9JL88_9GAMM|nr:exodeoxyribonuclease V subunit alpha [Xylella taiwanensis]AXI84134.1 exodeoxyribonuclease V subunit alpha [Xylella taiwanensis]EWS78954.1 exodeoxyribonuclease V subunit alpha [Xylella taiwanensis]MCD8457249.1 exodeoxyribonuclease V subunit alpha [Xylella taiwanensis]MCD8459659.1 exodeoxyribonuclease V subunit alpha [Xylella taiwanensis]MCD8461474.1 exodeoxyribonuclease V subunit alpha [Xylella taiwanensis]